MNKLWKKFDHLTQTCYSNISNGRAEDPDFAKELYLLDDETDYSHDVQGWLEDYLDALDMYEMYPELEDVCRKLLMLFEWKEDYPSEIRFLSVSFWHQPSETRGERRKRESTVRTGKRMKRTTPLQRRL